MHTRLNKICILIGVLTGLLALWSCDGALTRNDLEAIKAKGELVLITRNNAACYYEGPNGPSGFEFELAQAFGNYLGVTIKPLVIEEEADMIDALKSGQADIIAPGSPFGQQAARLLALGPGYLTVSQQVVGRRGAPDIPDIDSLAKTTIWITSSSARLEILRNLKTQHPDLTWQTLSEYGAEELLQMVWSKSLPVTIVESNILTMNRRFYPELVADLTIGEPRQLAWATDPGNRSLRKAIDQWFALKETQQFIQGLRDHYYGHLEDFDYVDLARYRRRIRSRLPKYQEHFEQAASEYGLDWYLVAAQSYQESHWDPRAQSFTGVRGMMMLTQETARTLGLKNRLEAKESIFAGALYLSRLHSQIGDGVPEPDRTLMALAAYNIGFGHLSDARELAKRLGKPENSWHGVRAVLPLLQQKKYYKTLSNGYARGQETVQYVDRIRTYHQVLIMAMSPNYFNGIGG
jgi:membrane-bound lytic murein transglycosylase F